jgi:single-stranded-DNA-specific exonuclease
MSYDQAGPQQPRQPLEWNLPTVDPAEVASLAAELRCPNAIAGLLLSRGISNPTSAHSFLNPTIDHLHDPMLMLGMGSWR